MNGDPPGVWILYAGLFPEYKDLIKRHRLLAEQNVAQKSLVVV